MTPGTRGLRVVRGGLLVHADGSVLEDAALAWRGDEIVAVGPWRALRRAVGDAPCEGGRDAVIVPGLVNAHQHGHGLTSLAGGVADQPLETWLSLGLAIPVPSDRSSILLAAARMIRSGVTTAVHLHACRSPVDPERMGIRLRAYRECGLSVGFASGFKSRHRFALVEDAQFVAGLADDLRQQVLGQFGALPQLDYLPAADWESAMRALVAEHATDGDRVRLMAGPAGPEWSQPADLERMASLARELDLPVQVHLAESPLQARMARRSPDTSGLGALERAGLVGERTSLVHVVHATSAELDRIADSGASVVTCPASNLRLGHGVAPVRAMRDRGIGIALGTDSIGFGDRDDSWAEARLLMALHGDASSGGAPLDVAFAWRAMTEAGAHVAGMPRAGRLEPGARADFVVLDGAAVSDPASSMLGAPAALVLGRARPQDVRLVVAAGRELLREGRILSFDEDAVRAEAQEAIERASRDPAAARLARGLAEAVARAGTSGNGAP